MFKRITSLSLAAMLLLSGTAYAEVSSQGPTATKDTSSGYLIIGKNYDESGNYVGAGPGVNGGSVVASNPNNGGYVIAGQSTPSGQGAAAQTGQSYQTGQGSTIQNPIIIGAGAGTAGAGAAAAVSVNTNVAKPEISSTAAVLYDATTGQIYYEKEGTRALAPASTTKLMTALLAAERLGLSESFSFNSSAVNNLESGAVTVNMTTGDTMTVKDALHALLLKSACEVANGLAEKISGSQSAFAELMNQRAKELGCTGTNFANASGLNSSSHYSTARDLALITRAALDNDTVRSILQTKSYTLPASKLRGSMTLTNGNKMLYSTNPEYVNGFVGGKTGYTSLAGNVLASECMVNGHKLIAVVMKSTQQHYNDTKALYNYGAKVLGGGTASAGTASAGTASAGTGAASPTGTAAATGQWKSTEQGWKYQKADGSYCKSEWLDVNGNTYFFGADEIMVTGWKRFTNGSWYFFDPANGNMVRNKWKTENGKSYYLQDDGTMARNKVIAGKYRVDDNGVYVENVGGEN